MEVIIILSYFTLIMNQNWRNKWTPLCWAVLLQIHTQMIPFLPQRPSASLLSLQQPQYRERTRDQTSTSRWVDDENIVIYIVETYLAIKKTFFLIPLASLDVCRTSSLQTLTLNAAQVFLTFTLTHDLSFIWLCDRKTLGPYFSFLFMLSLILTPSYIHGKAEPACQVQRFIQS